jgi:predicted metal-dependent hydrolase
MGKKRPHRGNNADDRKRRKETHENWKNERSDDRRNDWSLMKNNARFEAFYKAKGLPRIQKRVTYFAAKVGVTAGDIQIKDLGYRWASCTKRGDLHFHWKCLMAPLTIIDYIIVHELCHLHHRDHSDAFWNEVDKVLPDYRERKEWLRIRGAELDL